MNAFTIYRWQILSIGMLLLFSGCWPNQTSEDGPAESNSQEKQLSSFRKRIEGRFGQPNKAQIFGNGNDAQPMEVRNVRQLWALFVESPSWYETACETDFVQGLGSSRPADSVVQFICSCENDETNEVSFMIWGSDALCIVNGESCCFLDISENLADIESIQTD